MTSDAAREAAADADQPGARRLEGESGRVRAGPVGDHAGLALVVVCAAQFVLQLDFSIVNVALPAIQRELHFQAAWPRT